VEPLRRSAMSEAPTGQRTCADPFHVTVAWRMQCNASDVVCPCASDPIRPAGRPACPPACRPDPRVRVAIGHRARYHGRHDRPGLWCSACWPRLSVGRVERETIELVRVLCWPGRLALALALACAAGWGGRAVRV
jgi:hypothetical protein